MHSAPLRPHLGACPASCCTGAVPLLAQKPCRALQLGLLPDEEGRFGVPQVWPEGALGQRLGLALPMLLLPSRLRRAPLLLDACQVARRALKDAQATADVRGILVELRREGGLFQLLPQLLLPPSLHERLAARRIAGTQLPSTACRPSRAGKTESRPEGVFRQARRSPAGACAACPKATCAAPGAALELTRGQAEGDAAEHGPKGRRVVRLQLREPPAAFLLVLALTLEEALNDRRLPAARAGSGRHRHRLRWRQRPLRGPATALVPEDLGRWIAEPGEDVPLQVRLRVPHVGPDVVRPRPVRVLLRLSEPGVPAEPRLPLHGVGGDRGTQAWGGH
mmetsp:Transcript_7572/g.24051  ORF Transcript_7572/g.24051 Transcript_7572/m.24051 type:complete len:336 (+) Transcript_7572:56-1063(+)